MWAFQSDSHYMSFFWTILTWENHFAPIFLVSWFISYRSYILILLKNRKTNSCHLSFFVPFYLIYTCFYCNIFFFIVKSYNPISLHVHFTISDMSTVTLKNKNKGEKEEKKTTRVVTIKCHVDLHIGLFSFLNPF